MRREDTRDGWDSNSVVRLLIRLAINVLAIWVASHVIPGITPVNQLSSLLLVAVIFGAVNALIKPVFQFITCPLQLITLGLFTLVINAAMLGLTSWISERLSIPFHVEGFVAAFLGALVVSVISLLLSSFV